MGKTGKTTFINILKSVVFLLILGICIAAAAKVLRRKDSQFKYADFFDKASKDQIDVLFIGSSHVINAFNPVVLFDEYGITSYNMGGHGSVMQATYWELREALQYTKPKYVVVDTFLIQKDYQYLDLMYEDSEEHERRMSIDQLHLNMDVWPLNSLKIEAVKDLIFDKNTRREFLYDFFIYHGRWDELTENDFEVLTGGGEKNELFGAEMRYDIELTPGFYPDPEDELQPEEATVGMWYLKKIIDECKSNDIKVIVTFCPCSATTEDKKAAGATGLICKKNDVPFIDMNELEIVDLYTDLNDTGHLNASGAIKVTKYIGGILSETGEFTDHRNDPAYSDWQERADIFYDDIKELAISSDSIYQQLNYLAQDEVGCIIFINEGSQAFDDREMERLIRNIAGSDDFKNTDGPYILIKDPASENVYEASDGGTIEGVDTAFGTLYYQSAGTDFRLLYDESDEDTNYLYDDEKQLYDIQIITFDRDTGEELSHNYFRSYGNEYEH